jgi:K(+)-stimulated pyrophosphate-energized sodium pump
MGVSSGVWIAVLTGSVGGIVVGLVTEYYTGGSPVEKIAKDGETGSATVLNFGSCNRACNQLLYRYLQ